MPAEHVNFIDIHNSANTKVLKYVGEYSFSQLSVSFSLCCIWIYM